MPRTVSCSTARRTKSRSLWSVWSASAWARKHSRKQKRRLCRTTCRRLRKISRPAMPKWRSSSTWSRPEITDTPRHSLRWHGAIRTARVWKKAKKMRSCGTPKRRSRNARKRSMSWVCAMRPATASARTRQRPQNCTARRQCRAMRRHRKNWATAIVMA